MSGCPKPCARGGKGATVFASPHERIKRSVSARRRRPLKTHNDRISEERFSPTVGLEAEVVRSIQPNGAHQETRQLAAEQRGEGSEKVRPGKRRCLPSRLRFLRYAGWVLEQETLRTNYYLTPKERRRDQRVAYHGH
jgi:hypothetical protein